MKIFDKILSIIAYIMLFIWQLPQNIIALLMMPFLGKVKKVKFKNYCIAFEAEKMQGAISLGNFIYLSKYNAQRETSIAHEYGHTQQSCILGWFYLLVIGLPSILNAWLGFTECYYSWYTEKWANKLAGLGVDNLCRLYFLNRK